MCVSLSLSLSVSLSVCLSLILSLRTQRTQRDGGCLQARNRALTRNQTLPGITLDFQSPELWEIKFLLCKPPWPGYFLKKALVDWYKLWPRACLGKYVKRKGLITCVKYHWWIKQDEHWGMMTFGFGTFIMVIGYLKKSNVSVTNRLQLI